jgi:hypothetical protein
MIQDTDMAGMQLPVPICNMGLPVQEGCNMRPHTLLHTLAHNTSRNKPDLSLQTVNMHIVTCRHTDKHRWVLTNLQRNTDWSGDYLQTNSGYVLKSCRQIQQPVNKYGLLRAKLETDTIVTYILLTSRLIYLQTCRQYGLLLVILYTIRIARHRFPNCQT